MAETVSEIIKELYASASTSGFNGDSHVIPEDLLQEYKKRIKQALKESFEDAYIEGRIYDIDLFSDWFRELKIE